MSKRAPTGPPNVWGVGDIATTIEVTRATVAGWRSRPTFPPSGEVNSHTEVWHPSHVLAWVVDNAGTKAIAERARRLLDEQISG